MRAHLFSLALACAIGLSLFTWSAASAAPQKGGHSGGHVGSAHVSGVHAGSAHVGGAYHYGSGAYHHYGYGTHHYYAPLIYPFASALIPYPFSSGYGYSNYYNYGTYPYGFWMPAANDYSVDPYESYYFPPANMPAAGPAVLVNIGDQGFSSTELNVTLGTTLRWTNTSQQPHALAQPYRNWKGKDIAGGQTYSWTFSEPGTYELQDAANPNAKMTINVK